MKTLNIMVDIITHGGDALEKRLICAPGQVLKAVDFQHSVMPYADMLVYSYVTEQKDGIEHIYVVDHATGKTIARPCSHVRNAFAGTEVCGGFWGAGMLHVPVCGMYGTLYSRVWYMGNLFMPSRIKPVSGQAMLKAAGKAVPMVRYVNCAGAEQSASLAVSMLGPRLYCRYSKKAADYLGLGKDAVVKMTAPQEGSGQEEFLPLPIPTLLSPWDDVIGHSLGITKDTDGSFVMEFVQRFYRAVFEFVRDTEDVLYIGHKFNPVVRGLDTGRAYTVKEYRNLFNTDMSSACADGSGASLRNIGSCELHVNNPFGAVDASMIATAEALMLGSDLRAGGSLAGTL